MTKREDASENPASAPAVDVDALVKVVADLQSRQERREIELSRQVESLRAQLADVQAVPVGKVQVSGKWSDVIDAVADVKGVLAACAVFDRAKDEDDQAVAFATFAAKFPALAQAASSNAVYRKKPISHSIGVIVRRLNARGGK